MANYRKLGRTSSQRKAMMRNLTTNLLYHEKIVTTETRAKEIRSMTEKLITLSKKEADNFEEVTVTAKVPKKVKVAEGKAGDNNKAATAVGGHQRVKEVVNGKRVTVFEEVEKTIKKDLPSRLNARRKILSVLYPVTEIPKARQQRRAKSVKVDMAAKLFDELAPRYKNRNGGYTRIIKLGPRKGDGSMQVIIELV